MMNLPVLIIVFSRPQTALMVLKAISIYKPQMLFIASDAGRTESEQFLVEHTRTLLLNNITWDCEVKTLFHKDNLGCGNGVYTAINWFFNNVEEGIILEDDCVPNISFFSFAEVMLDRYKYDLRVGMIAGTNPICLSSCQYSYIFSKYKSCWGWATWRRAWANMDFDMDWRSQIPNSVLFNMGYCGKDISGWKYKLRCIDKKVVSAWDWQWYFALSAQNQLCIYPSVNLVSNIGDDVNATHTSFSKIRIASKELKFPLNHPTFVVADIEFDEKFYKSSNTIVIKILRLIPSKLKKKAKKIMMKF